MVTDTNLYNLRLKYNRGEFIIGSVFTIKGYVVFKLIRVVVILFGGITGCSLRLESEKFTAFSKEELDAHNDMELGLFKAKEEHSKWYLPTSYSSEYKDSKIRPFNGNIRNNKNTVSSYRQFVSPYNTRYKGAAYRKSKYKKSSSSSQYKPVYVRGYHRRDGTYVRPHYRSRPNRRR